MSPRSCEHFGDERARSHLDGRRRRPGLATCSPRCAESSALESRPESSSNCAVVSSADGDPARLAARARERAERCGGAGGARASGPGCGRSPSSASCASRRPRSSSGRSDDGAPVVALRASASWWPARAACAASRYVAPAASRAAPPRARCRATTAAVRPLASGVFARCMPRSWCMRVARAALERAVGDVARQRVPDVDDVALHVAEAARARDASRAPALRGRRAPSRSFALRAGRRRPRATRRRCALRAAARSGGRRSAARASRAASSAGLASPLDPHELLLLPSVCSRISSCPRSSSVSTISSRKKGLPAARGNRSAQTCATPSLTPRRAWRRRT